MLSNIQSSVPIIFLVTDGTVEDERQICAMVKNRMINGESICPRIYTFGIGMVPNIFSLDQNFATCHKYKHFDVLFYSLNLLKILFLV